MYICLGSFLPDVLEKFAEMKNGKKSKRRIIMSLKSLQEKIGVTADGAFGPGTIKKAMEFL